MCGGMCLYTCVCITITGAGGGIYNSGIVCVRTHMCELIYICIYIQICALLRMILSDFSYIISVHEC